MKITSSPSAGGAINVRTGRTTRAAWSSRPWVMNTSISKSTTGKTNPAWSALKPSAQSEPCGCGVCTSETPSRGLVSSMYDRAPSDGYATPEETKIRLREWMQRLMKRYGIDEIHTRIIKSSGDREIKDTLLRALESEIARVNLHKGASS